MIFQAYSAPYHAEALNRGTSGLSELHSSAVAVSYDFSGCRSLCDVEGGYGHLLGMTKFIHMTGTTRRRPTIPQNVRAAMTPETRLLIVDAVIPRGNEPSMNKFLDLQMLVALSGRERTEEEFSELLSSAGLQVRISEVPDSDAHRSPPNQAWTC